MNRPTLPFKWVMHDGAEISVPSMRTRHLFYSVRMVYNALAPKQYRIEGNVWDLSRRPVTYWKQAVIVMLAELANRKDVQGWMQKQLEQMRENSKKLATLQLQ